MQPKSATV